MHENERGELAKLRGRHICPVGQMHLRGLAACRRALVLPTVEERGEEFVLRAMYRQERSLSHSSCSLESCDTLTFSQLSWYRTKTGSTQSLLRFTVMAGQNGQI